LVLNVDTASQEDLAHAFKDRDTAIWSVGVRRFVMVSYFEAGKVRGVPAHDPFFAYAEFDR
jgi:hypothetical protein